MDSTLQPGPSARAPTGARPFSGTARRVLIIGLDGATFDVLNPLMAEGRMPRLQAAIASGASAVLRSTTPPITPAAWTTFLTGRQPGSHGIIDFQRYDVHTNKLEFNSARCLDHVRNLWQILGDSGLKVGSVNVPMTYPAVPVNGFLVSGFEAPGPDSNFVYPPELKSEILARWPDPTLGTRWRRKFFGADKLFAENVAYISRSFLQGAEMTIWLGDRHGWDVLMVVFKLLDNLQHKTWKHLDPRWSHRRPVRRELAKKGFEAADKAVGMLLDYAEANAATVIMVSDHGHGSLEGRVQPNLMLKRWGYLSLRGGGAQKVTRGRTLLRRLRRRAGRFTRIGDIAGDLAVDFSTTKACVMHAGMAGFLYINLKGRQPAGIVKPADYESLRNELKNRFLGGECRVRDPRGNTVRLFSEVHAPEELYACSRESRPWLPDLLLIPHESLAVIRKIRGKRVVRWLPYRRLEGTHRPDGVFVAMGPGIAQTPPVENRCHNLRAHIVDCAPTILAMLGLPVPNDMEGRVITEIFEKPPVVERSEPRPLALDSSLPTLRDRREATTGEARSDVSRVRNGSGVTKEPPALGSSVPSGRVKPATQRESQTEQVYSPEELQQVTERLSDLGYLE